VASVIGRVIGIGAGVGVDKVIEGILIRGRKAVVIAVIPDIGILPGTIGHLTDRGIDMIDQKSGFGEVGVASGIGNLAVLKVQVCRGVVLQKQIFIQCRSVIAAGRLV
jgi:hypothetical protein